EMIHVRLREPVARDHDVEPRIVLAVMRSTRATEVEVPPRHDARGGKHLEIDGDDVPRSLHLRTLAPEQDGREQRLGRALAQQTKTNRGRSPRDGQMERARPVLRSPREAAGSTAVAQGIVEGAARSRTTHL